MVFGEKFEASKIQTECEESLSDIVKNCYCGKIVSYGRGGRTPSFCGADIGGVPRGISRSNCIDCISRDGEKNNKVYLVSF